MTLQQILQEFEDFYWEKGIYEKRQLGINGYKNFISRAVVSALEACEPEMRYYSKKHGTKEQKGFDKCLSDYQSAKKKFLEI